MEASCLVFRRRTRPGSLKCDVRSPMGHTSIRAANQLALPNIRHGNAEDDHAHREGGGPARILVVIVEDEYGHGAEDHKNGKEWDLQLTFRSLAATDSTF